MLEDRAERNKARHIFIKAEKEEVITKEEVAFIVSLVENGRKEIEKKTSKLNSLKGEIAQLKENKLLLDEAKKESSKDVGTRLSNLFAQRFLDEIDKKTVMLDMLKGEIAQLKSTERAIVDVIENLIKAKERDLARQEIAKKLREAREVEKERHDARKKALLKEQADSTKETKEDVAKKSGLHEPKKNKK